MNVDVGDLDLEVLFHPVALQRGPDRQPDLGGAEQRAAVHASLDQRQVGLGRGQEFLAFAGALRADQRVAAHDQPLPGELARVGDLAEVLLVKQRRLEHAGSGEFLDRRGFQRGDPVHPVGLGEQLDVRLGDHPTIRDDHDPRAARTGPSAC